MGTSTASVAHAREERIAEALAERKEALVALADACENLSDAHDRRRIDYEFLTLSETTAIEILRIRMDEFHAAANAVIHASRDDDN